MASIKFRIGVMVVFSCLQPSNLHFSVARAETIADLTLYESTQWSCSSDITLSVLPGSHDLTITWRTKSLDMRIAFVNCENGVCAWKGSCIGPACGDRTTDPLRAKISTVKEKPIVTLLGSLGSTTFKQTICVGQSQKELNQEQAEQEKLLGTGRDLTNEHKKVIEDHWADDTNLSAEELALDKKIMAGRKKQRRKKQRKH